MSNSQNTENEQQNNLCTTLTEQWKKGELEYGKEYYVRFENGEIGTAQWCYYTYQDRYGFDVDDIVEVLALVPRYGDCLINETLIKDLSKKVNKLIKENQQLKELLKEGRGLLDNYNHTFETKDWEKSSNLITKIENAIGDK